MTEIIEGGCPRRAETGSTRGLPDRWQKRGGHLACSYCGSSHPDEVMRAIAAGEVVLGPTDKNYKVYLEHSGLKLGMKFYLQHLSEEQRSEFIRLYNEDRETREYHEDLSFTVTRPGAMKLGYPGRFYAGIFFARPA